MVWSVEQVLLIERNLKITPLFSLTVQFLDFLLIFIPVFLSVALLTLVERKVMGSMQNRRGPNVIGIFGILQPIADGVKLLLKEPIFPYNSEKNVFLFSPILTFWLSICIWGLIPLSSNSVTSNIELSLLLILGISSLSVYGIIFAGWSSNSKYAFIGGLRSAAQMISYEVSLSLTILPVVLITSSLNLTKIVDYQKTIWFILPLFPAALGFFISSLAETSRTPFDLPEAEGELVAGFNVEYSAFSFAMFFLAEYSNIIAMSMLFSLLFLGGWHCLFFSNAICLSFKLLIILYFFVWIRASLPRYRYDQLMQLGWKVFLPIYMSYFLFVSGFCYFFFSVLKYLTVNSNFFIFQTLI